MSSGLAIEDSCVSAFKELKARKINVLLYRLNDDFTAIIPDYKGKVSSYDDFVEMLPENEPRYAFHDYEFTTGDGRKTAKIVMFSWLPETTPIKQKMVFASSKTVLKSSLDGISAEIQATDYSDLDAEEVASRIAR
ncbi:MAG: hypothetical protein HOZ81_33750 [Streptomyces sp.]|nr:hypothetical protein [Streptomyces sp.]